MHDDAKGKTEAEKSHGRMKTDLKGITYQLGRAGINGRSDFGGHSEMFQNSNEIKFNVMGYRMLPRVFSTLEDFGVIEELEPACSSDQLGETTSWFSRPLLSHRESPRRKSTTSWLPSETQQQRSQNLSEYRNNRRRQSDGLLASGRKTFGLVGYHINMNESSNDISSGEQRSGNPSPHIKQLLKRENNAEDDKTTHDSTLPSFEIMTSVGAVFDRPKSYSLPRKLSMPAAQSLQIDSPSVNRKQQRKSLPSDDPRCLQHYNFDNDTELQWKKLVERAKTLQFMTKTQEVIPSRLSNNNKEQVTREASKPAGDLENGVDNRVEKEKMYEGKTVREESTTRRRRKSEEKRRDSLKIIANGIESSDENQNKADCIDKVLEKHMTQTPQHGRPVIQQRCKVMTDRNHNDHRRHSVAVLRPTQEVTEKVSGYSTHGALEYAKMLLGKIQEEGKTKTKKQRLDEMSKALKLVLEELNRIELPDRDLVSLFISLRAKMVNLRGELKADEGEKDIEKEEDSDEKIVSKTSSLPARRDSHKEMTTSVHSRRFSWC